ncbi:hypothetical protein F511_19592 [Dorcoceras hygrometricum]|uniref:Uncharacterized protein n=1 Tax=Dorcoceras hygrometricum TaxID=472368 RepID=A0A2Z7A6J7_9LAMI|nr:hypothetical protein F511_19592 [Dorcoceras hygrometricum]
MRSVVASHGPGSNPRGAWLRPVSRGNRHFTVDGGRLRRSGPRPEGRLLRQPAIEGLTRSARTDSPRQVGRNKFRIGYPRMSASGESSTTMHRLLHASGSHPILPPNDPKRCVLVGSSSNADVDFKRWYFSCDGQQRAVRDSEAMTFCEQEPAVGFTSVFLSGFHTRFLGTPCVVIVAQNVELLHTRIFHSAVAAMPCCCCSVSYQDARASGNTALSSPCWDRLAAMRRVVNYHSSWVGQRQVELFDASGIRVWCKDERVIPVFLYTHQWPPFVADSVELCLSSLAPFFGCSLRLTRLARTDSPRQVGRNKFRLRRRRRRAPAAAACTGGDGGVRFEERGAAPRA